MKHCTYALHVLNKRYSLGFVNVGDWSSILLSSMLHVHLEGLFVIVQGKAVLETDIGVNALLPVEKAASDLAVWKDILYRLDNSLLKVNVDGLGRVVKQLLQLEEGLIVGIRLLIW